MSEYVSPRHAQLVADYKAAQERSGENVWPDRDDAPYRIRGFVMEPVGDEQ
jgi:hypothetical protein